MKTKKILPSLIIAFLLCFTANLAAAQTTKVECFTRVTCDNPKINNGDSTLFRVNLYATIPFQQVRAPKAFKIKSCNVRLAYRNDQLQQSRIVENGRLLYLLTFDIYSIGGDQNGKYTFPAMKFDVVLAEQQMTNIFDPFSQFFGRREAPKTYNKKVSTSALNFSIIDKPQRTTREMMQSGNGTGVM